jgi:vacuolar-type H+-ATPase subunit I/STV1
MLETLLYPVLASLLTGFGMKLIEKRKNNATDKALEADAKSKEIDNEIKSSEFYKGLIENGKKQLDDAIVAINNRDIKIDNLTNQLSIALQAIKDRDLTINERDRKIDLLIDEIETLTGEIRKYKQLNGKTE